MVRIVENWSLVQGRIVSVAPASEVNNFSLVEIDLLATEGVDGFPDLLQRDVGNRVCIHVPDDAAKVMSVGAQVTLRVRRAGANRIFAAVD